MTTGIFVWTAINGVNFDRQLFVQCSGKRYWPDFMIRKTYHIIIVEVDKNKRCKRDGEYEVNHTMIMSPSHSRQGPYGSPFAWIHSKWIARFSKFYLKREKSACRDVSHTNQSLHQHSIQSSFSNEQCCSFQSSQSMLSFEIASFTMKKGWRNLIIIQTQKSL